MITVYGICYNEKFMLHFFVRHYREMFPGCKIIIYDNESTDGSRDLAINLGCEVIVYRTNDKLSDAMYLKIKQECWKESDTPWVLIADIDEHLYITENELLKEEENGTTVISSMGFNMVNLKDNMNFDSITYGVRSVSYDKVYLFDKNVIDNISYSPGAHTARMLGTVVYSTKSYTLKHYKYINEEYMISRHALFASRLSEENINRGWGCHYLYPPDKIRNEFKEARENAQFVK